MLEKQEMASEEKRETATSADTSVGGNLKKEKWKKAGIAALLAVVTFCTGALTTWLSLDPEIRSLIKLKNTIKAEYYEEMDDSEFYSAVFGGINQDLLDPYSYYMTADEYAQVQNEAKGNRSGLGLSFTKNDAEELRVSLVCGNSPAEEAGVVAGTYLLGGGASADTIVAFENYDAFSVFLQDYEEGEILYLQTRNGEEERVIEIAKADYVENYVYYRTKDSAYRFTGTNATDMTEGGEVLSALPDDTAYIRLTGFNGSAATQFSKAMEKMREDGKVNLVLDLRTNGGGYMRIFREIAKYFCKTATSATPLVCIADYKKKQENYYATSNVYKEYFSEESRICVLADNGTASASECLLGVMLDYQAISYADICLSQRNGIAKTYGKGIMQTTFFLPFGLDAVKLTTAKMLWPVSGNCIHGIGILPSNGALVVEELPFDDKEIANAIEKLGL